jgi:hypothetical protein
MKACARSLQDITQRPHNTDYPVVEMISCVVLVLCILNAVVSVSACGMDGRSR